MKRYYSFTASGVCQASKYKFEALCISYGSDIPETSDAFYGDITKALQEGRKVLPDCVVIMAPDGKSTLIRAFWSEKKDQILTRSNRNGIDFVKCYYFFDFKIGEIEEVGAELISKSKFSIPIEEFLKQGIGGLVTKNGVVQVAPSGHAFRHPSGTVNKTFIQARELATNEPELFFISRTIVKSIGDVLVSAEVVYIDTMSIYNYVRLALEFCESSAKIESFHSYDGLKKNLKKGENRICVISASTSGGMAKRVVLGNEFPDSKVLTLIDKSDKDRRGKILLSLNHLEADDGLYIKDTSETETEIEIAGEHFLSKAKPPKSITLGFVHEPENLKHLLRYFAKNVEVMLPINSSPHDGADARTICFDAKTLIGNGKFETWLKEEISWNISITIDTVVHADDPASMILAQHVADEIRAILGAVHPISIIAQKDVLNRLQSSAKGIVVVSAVTGNGGVLREISRDLREKVPTEVPRHFITGIGLPKSTDLWENLKIFLKGNATKRKYGFSNWITLPVGNNEPDPNWDCLTELSQKTDSVKLKLAGVSDDNADKSLGEAKRVLAGSKNHFLPKSDGQKLKLTGGFVFFGDLFKDDDELSQVTDSATYLAISSALQYARETKNVKYQLRSTSYESVVLSPETFLRFNDGILQAALLRACHPSELDYSSSPNFSMVMKEVLMKIFDRRDAPYGDAAFEFAAALASSKLKLKKDDFNFVVNTTIGKIGDQASALLGILMVAKDEMDTAKV